MKSCTPAIPRWFPKKWLFGFFILEKQLASQNLFLEKSELSLTTYLFLVFFSNIGIGIRRGWWRTENSTWTPWFSFPREKQRVFIFKPSFWLTLFYSTLLALTHRQKDRRRVKYTRYAWAGGTFFPVVLLCLFWFWREIGFGCTYYYVIRVPYSCGVVLVFLVLAGNSFWCYIRT